jgi:hypothetical protein
MGYQFKCRDCQEFIYLERVSDRNTDYNCPNCQSINWIDSSWHGLEVVTKDEFENKTINSNESKNHISTKSKKQFLPKHHNLITTIVRLFVLLLGFIIMAVPYSILWDVYGLSMVLLTIIIVWPGMYLTLYIIKKIKVGKHYSERNKKIKNFVKDISNKSDYIGEIERLSSLKDKGIITDEEFQQKKKELLDL